MIRTTCRGVFAVAVLLAAPLVQATAIEEAANATFDQALLAAAPRPSGRLDRLAGYAQGRTPGAAARFDSVVEAYWQWSLAVSPELATFVGVADNAGRWSDDSDDTRAALHAMREKALTAVEAFDPHSLDADRRLSRAILIDELRTELDAYAFPAQLMPMDATFGRHTEMVQVLGAMPLTTPAQADAFLQRLRSAPLLLAQTTARLRAGLKAGVTPPRITLAKLPDQVLGLAPEDAQDSPLLQPLWSLPDTLQADAPRIQRTARAIYDESLRPALLALHLFLRDTYLPGAVEATGLSALPDGQAWYAQRIRAMTTTDLSAREIHRIGLEQVERLRGEMQRTLAEVGFKGSIAEFAKAQKTRADVYYTDPQRFLADYRILRRDIDAALPQLFGRLPKLGYVIEPVPAYASKGAPTAYYIPGAAAFDRQGVFYVNTGRLPDFPRYQMVPLLLHEAAPGHHFQITLTQENTALPEFRRHLRHTAFIEGWALYAETFGYELGYYDDPHVRFAALTYQMLRAVRLVVDTGMHALGWSREQAIEYFRTNTGLGTVRATAEIDRYLVAPGQALGYMLGALKIQALHDEAQRRLGAAFDRRAFHDRLLSQGSLPLPVLETMMKQWIEEQEKAS